MARANLDKSKKVLTSCTTAGIKVNTQVAQNLHQLKSPLSDSNLLRKNIVKQDLIHKKQSMNIL